MTDIKIDKKATDYLKETLGGGQGGDLYRHWINILFGENSDVWECTAIVTSTSGEDFSSENEDDLIALMDNDTQSAIYQLEVFGNSGNIFFLYYDTRDGGKWYYYPGGQETEITFPFTSITDHVRKAK